MKYRRRRLPVALLALALLFTSTRSAHASYEEFESLDVARQEEDDENLLDHVLVQSPEDWLDDWNFYQARNIRQDVATAAATQLRLAAESAPASQQAKYRDAIASGVSTSRMFCPSIATAPGGGAPPFGGGGLRGHGSVVEGRGPCYPSEIPSDISSP